VLRTRANSRDLESCLVKFPHLKISLEVVNRDRPQASARARIPPHWLTRLYRGRIRHGLDSEHPRETSGVKLGCRLAEPDLAEVGGEGSLCHRCHYRERLEQDRRQWKYFTDFNRIIRRIEMLVSSMILTHTHDLSQKVCNFLGYTLE